MHHLVLHGFVPHCCVCSNEKKVLTTSTMPLTMKTYNQALIVQENSPDYAKAADDEDYRS